MSETARLQGGDFRQGNGCRNLDYDSLSDAVMGANKPLTATTVASPRLRRASYGVRSDQVLKWGAWTFALFLTVAPPWRGMCVRAATMGQELSDVQIRDADDKPTSIPGFGKKALGIFYNDADAADMNDPLADVLKAKDFDERKYEGIGVANLKDSKLPNFLIRRIIRGKIEKYDATILTDPDLLLPKAWDLGDCNNTSVFVLLGKDKKVKYVNKGPIRGEEVGRIVRLIEDLIK